VEDVNADIPATGTQQDAPVILRRIDPTCLDVQNLSEVEFEGTEMKFVGELRERGFADDVVCVWLTADEEYANLVRTLEARTFPELPELMADYEHVSVFGALVDPRGEGRIAHGFRLSTAASNPEAPVSRSGLGMPLVDDLFDSGQGLDPAVFIRYYQEAGVDLTKCISVETNFVVGSRTKSNNGQATPVLAYLSMFSILENIGVETGNACIFTHLNRPASISLGAMGVEYGPIAGRQDLQTPTVVGFDSRYRPYSIEATPTNIAVLQRGSQFAPVQHVW
jgi:hypothetical protein